MKRLFAGCQSHLGLVLLAALLAGLSAPGCDTRRDEVVCTEAQYRLLMPAKIDVLPFTKPRSWDDDQIPDGIEVVLRPLDSFGDQTKAIGTFRFELYTFQKANAEVKGRRVGFWEETLCTRDAQCLHWDKITRTYRFRLAWTGEQMRPGRYVLEVTYLAPSGPRLTDTYIMDARQPPEQTKEKIESKQNAAFNPFAR